MVQRLPIVLSCDISLRIVNMGYGVDPGFPKPPEFSRIITPAAWQVLCASSPAPRTSPLTGGTILKVVTAVIEIPQGSQNKYEYDVGRRQFSLGRVLYGSMHYPVNYGCVPDTWGEDHDPLDNLVIGSTAIDPMMPVSVRLVGVFSMTGNHGPDAKLIGVVDRDPRLAHVNRLDDLAPHLLKEIAHFFSQDKVLEGLPVTVSGYHDVEDAVKIFDQACLRFQQLRDTQLVGPALFTITGLQGFQVFDSREWPTLAVEVSINSGNKAITMVPSGAQTGSREARELREGVFSSGRGVTHPCDHSYQYRHSATLGGHGCLSAKRCG